MDAFCHQWKTTAVTRWKKVYCSSAANSKASTELSSHKHWTLNAPTPSFKRGCKVFINSFHGNVAALAPGLGFVSRLDWLEIMKGQPGKTLFNLFLFGWMNHRWMWMKSALFVQMALCCMMLTDSHIYIPGLRCIDDAATNKPLLQFSLMFVFSSDDDKH